MKVLSAFILLIVGCSAARPAADQPAQQKAASNKSYVGRFQPFKNLPGVALDTMSGKLCRTFEPKPGENSQEAIPSQYNSQPLCSSLSNCD